MSINNESDLVKEFIKKYKIKNNVKVITELETNFGRPDIVIITINEDKLNTRRNNCCNEKFLRKYSYILSFLFGKSWVSFSRINGFFNFSNFEMNKALQALDKMNLIDIKGDLVKSKPAREILVLNRLKVIEAKLSNWKYVIEQAERHFWFSKESSILLPDISENIIAKSMRKCKKSGIGLFIFDGNKNVELLKPYSKGLVNTPLLWELNEKLVQGEIEFESKVTSGG